MEAFLPGPVVLPGADYHYHIISIIISIDAMIGMMGMTIVLLRRKGEDLLMDRIREEEEEKAA